MKTINRLQQPQTFLRKLRNWLDSGKRGICLLCGQYCRETQFGICDQCMSGFYRHKGELCQKCGRESDRGVCSSCKKVKAEFDGGTVPFFYEGTVVSLVHRMKFRGDFYLADVLGAMIADTILKKNLQAVDYIVPVPCHWIRRLKRGMNIPDLVAGSIGDILKVPVLYRALKRKKYTVPKVFSGHSHSRTDTYLSDRDLNLNGKCVLLVDDVITTGATLQECTHLLKLAGAKKVFIAATAGNV